MKSSHCFALVALGLVALKMAAQTHVYVPGGTGGITNVSNSSANVGIGTSSPGAKLEVIGGSNAFGLIVEGDGSAAHARIALRRGNAGGGSATGNLDWIGNDNTVGARIGVNDDVAGSMAFKLGGGTQSYTRLFISSGGYVGIGTTSPSTKFQVADASQPWAELYWTGTASSGNKGLLRFTHNRQSDGTREDLAYIQAVAENDQSNGGLRFVTRANTDVEALRLTSSGDVGIGTATPGAALDISRPTHAVLRVSAVDGANDRLARLVLSGSGNGGALSSGAVIDFADSDATPSSPGALVFNKGSSTLMTLLAGGNLGVGTVSPDARLEVTVGDNGGLNIEQAGAGQTGYLTFRDSDGGLDGRVSYDHYNNSMRLTTAGAERVRVDAEGKVGIGMTNPGEKLQVKGNLAFESANTSVFRIVPEPSTNDRILQFENASGAGDGGFAFKATDGAFAAVRMKINNNGNVGIGTTSPSHKLAVNGTIKAKEVIVETSGWSDYVFADSYQLSALSEVERHIKEKKHLPGIPSAAEVEQGGVSLGDMQARLLAKIEELTLHQIAQEKKLAALAALNASQQSEIVALRAQLDRLSPP